MRDAAAEVPKDSFLCAECGRDLPMSKRGAVILVMGMSMSVCAACAELAKGAEDGDG